MEILSIGALLLLLNPSKAALNTWLYFDSTCYMLIPRGKIIKSKGECKMAEPRTVKHFEFLQRTLEKRKISGYTLGIKRIKGTRVGVGVNSRLHSVLRRQLSSAPLRVSGKLHAIWPLLVPTTVRTPSVWCQKISPWGVLAPT
ncbi:hypothetical protein BaRGS_00019543 [Batillaria attramentaria]|uniref:Secreted protein n=1 Tax=Batillaria attramentaria TaxID=370345 RepID=A0ABD0KPJ8_9CAEN